MDRCSGDNFELAVGQYLTRARSVVFHCIVRHNVSSAVIPTEYDIAKVDMARVPSCRSAVLSIDSKQLLLNLHLSIYAPE